MHGKQYNPLEVSSSAVPEMEARPAVLSGQTVVVPELLAVGKRAFAMYWLGLAVSHFEASISGLIDGACHSMTRE